MWERLKFKQKKVILIAVISIITIIAYQLSFRKTFDAIALNRKLNEKGLTSYSSEAILQQLKRENQFYVNALNGYGIKDGDIDNRLWQSISEHAIANHIDITFNQSNTPIVDTTIAKNVVVRKYSLKGEFFNVVKFLDTISKSKWGGKIAEIKLSTNKDDENKIELDKLILNITTVSIKK